MTVAQLDSPAANREAATDHTNAGALNFPCVATSIITRRVRAGKEADYEQWMDGITGEATAFDGYLGTTVLRPQPGDDTYIVIINFTTGKMLERWMTSPARLGWIDKAKSLTLDDAEVQTLTGLERWFTLPSRAVSRSPERYKMAALTSLGLYPLLIVLTILLSPVIGSWPWPLRILTTVVIGVPLMTWAVMPLVTRLFFRWLYSH
jgi:antibiotic biosynthesis monooxygenase (ABM) superfamily enzyme